MNQVSALRENTRRLEMQLANINETGCCCGCGVSDSQCFVLVEIGRKPGISAKELAEILKIDKSGISRTVEELVQKNYVVREPSPQDRRFVVLNLTKEGEEHFNKIETEMDKKFGKILKRIPRDRRSQVIEALRVLADACEEGECCGGSSGSSSDSSSVSSCGCCK